jgi:predicted permease
MRTLYQDLRFGLRIMNGHPWFTIVAVLTLALGIAANATVFSWVDGLLLHPFPGASDSSQLAVFEMITADAPNGAIQVSYLDYRDYRDNLKSISGLAVHREDVFNLGEAGNTQAVWGELVSGNYFAVLGVKPVLGRVFAPEEYGDKPGAYPVAVISHRLWRTRFRSDPALAGKSIRVNRHQLTVAGVAPPEFRGTMPGLAFDIWIPVTLGVELGMVGESTFSVRGDRKLYAVARLKPGVTIEQARAEAASTASNLAAAYPRTNRGRNATILPAWEFHSAAPGLLLGPLRILMAVAVVVLLIVCANVANLLLARSVSRQKEFGIRLALGAGKARLARQLFTETLLLAGLGALVALPLVFWMWDSLPSLVPKIGAPVGIELRLNGQILGFMILTCVTAAVISGVAPALFSARSDVNETLKEGGRGGSAGAHSHRMRSFLVVCEVALAAVALAGAGLFARSFQNARTIDPGFDKTNVLLSRFYMGSSGYSSQEVQQFCLRLREQLQSAPGILNVSYADYAPLGSSGGPYTSVEVEGFVPAPEQSMAINRYLVAPGYFGLLRIPLLSGRDFAESDDAQAAPVLIVSETFARRFFHGSNPVGRKIRCWGKWRTVVGLAKDAKYFDVAEAPRPHFYAPMRQAYGGQDVYFYAKTAGDPIQAIPTLRREVAGVDPNAGAFFPMPLSAWTEVTLLPQKVAASMLGALGLISLVLAAVGLYSVMAYAVSQRTHEIGIRMALGAQPRDVLGMVVRQGMTLTLAGLAAGIAGALAGARLVASLLVHVSAADPATFAAVALFLGSVALAASYVPARRATRVDPIASLRCE